MTRPGPCRARGTRLSPDGPGHFSVVFGKLQRMWREGQPMLTVSDLAKIRVPVLVVAGDDDVVHHAHTVALYEAVAREQLAIQGVTAGAAR